MTVRIFSLSVPSAREDQIRIPQQPCNILFIIWISMNPANIRKPQSYLSIHFKRTVNSGHLN